MLFCLLPVCLAHDVGANSYAILRIRKSFQYAYQHLLREIQQFEMEQQRKEKRKAKRVVLSKAEEEEEQSNEKVQTLLSTLLTISNELYEVRPLEDESSSESESHSDHMHHAPFHLEAHVPSTPSTSHLSSTSSPAISSLPSTPALRPFQHADNDDVIYVGSGSDEEEEHGFSDSEIMEIAGPNLSEQKEASSSKKDSKRSLALFDSDDVMEIAPPMKKEKHQPERDPSIPILPPMSLFTPSKPVKIKRNTDSFTPPVDTVPASSSSSTFLTPPSSRSTKTTSLE